jgi:hypothetical protein
MVKGVTWQQEKLGKSSSGVPYIDIEDECLLFKKINLTL